MLLVIFCAGEARAFVFPPGDSLARTDGFVVLGGATFSSRVTTAVADVQRFPGTTLLISNPTRLPCPRVPVPHACFTPHPYSTQGEARAARAYADAHHWRSITVITSADQIGRARVRFRRCWPGPLRMRIAPSSIAHRLRQIPYETAAVAKAEVWQRGC